MVLLRDQQGFPQYKNQGFPDLFPMPESLICTQSLKFISEAKIMKTQKTITAISLIAALFFVGLPFSSASAEEILTAQEHLQLAKHHELLLKEAEDKLVQHKAALEDYEDRPYYYGRRGQDFQSHEKANIREYEKIVAENKAQVAIHYQLAGESQTPQFVSGSTNNQVN